jgi:plastocyanin
MRKFLVLVACLAALAVIVPASAGAAVSAKKKAPVKISGKTNNHGTKTVKGTSIEVEMDDFYFSPTFVKAKPGSTVSIELKNEGKQQHNFSISGQSIDQNVDPDQKMTVSVTVPASGNLVFFCKFHQSFGMQGALFTKAGTATKTTAIPQTTATPQTTTGGSSGYGY